MAEVEQTEVPPAEEQLLEGEHAAEGEEAPAEAAEGEEEATGPPELSELDILERMEKMKLLENILVEQGEDADGLKPFFMNTSNYFKYQ